MAYRDLTKPNPTDIYCKNLTVSNILTAQSIVYENTEVVESTQNSTSPSTGASIVLGGAGIVKDLYVGGTIYGNINGMYNPSGVLTINNTTPSTSSSTGALIVSGGVGIAENLYVNGIVQSAVNDVVKSPSGFEDTTTSTISYDPLTRIFSIAPVGDYFNVWVSGRRYQFTTTQTTTAHNTTSGIMYYYYFTSSGLTYSTNFPNLRTTALCCSVYYYNSDHYIAVEERHGCVMDCDTHFELHKQIGTFYVSGLALSNYNVKPISPSNADNQFSSASGIIADEDLQTSISIQASGSYTILQLTGANSLWTYSSSTVPFIFAVDDYIKYNQYTDGSWTLTSIGNNSFTNYYVVYVPSLSSGTQMLLLPSQTTYSTFAAAAAEAITNLTLGTLPFEEFLPRYKITFGTKNIYTNAGKCRIESVEILSGTRVSILSASVNNHQALSGLQLASSGSTYGHITDTTQSIFGIKTFSDTTNSTSTSTGAVIVNGGVGIGKKLYVGGELEITGSTSMTDINLTGRIESYNNNNLMRNNFSNSTLGTRAVSTWTTQASAANNNWNKVVWSAELGLFCAVAQSGTGNRVMTSSDGITWTTRASAADNTWKGICWSPELSLFCAVSDSGTGNRVMTSPDGITWTTRTSASNNNWYNVIWSSELGIFCAVAGVGTSGTYVMTSPDGINWTTRTTPVDNVWWGISWSPELGLFCAVSISVASGDSVMTSPDGIVWTTRTTPNPNRWTSVNWSPELGIFCAVSDTGTGNRVMTSPDGITWTTRTSAADNDWQNISWSPELGSFCAVSTIGTVMTSLDGITWTTRSSGSNNVWQDVCWSPELGIFCSVAYTGTSGTYVMTSKQVTDTKSRQYIDGIVSMVSSVSSTSSTTGALVVNGGVGIGGNLSVGGDITSTGIISTTTTLKTTDPTTASSTSTGAFQVTGGVGIGKKLYVGGELDVSGSTILTSSNTFGGGNSSTTFIATYSSIINGDYGLGSTLVVTTAGTVSITNGKLVLGTGTGNYVRYSAQGNADFTQAGTIKFKITPNYSGAPTANTGLIGIGTSGVTTNTLYLFHKAVGGGFSLAVYNSENAVVIDRVFAVWSPVAGTEYEIELNCDFTAGVTNLFINGVKQGSGISTTLTRTTANLSVVQIGGYVITPANDLSNFSMRELIIYNTVQHTAAYTPGYALQNSLTVYGKSVFNGGISSNGASSIISTNPRQLTLGYDTTNNVLFDVSSSGDLTIDAYGNDINMASTDTVRVLNATASTSTSTGALIVSGGCGIAGNLNIGGELVLSGEQIVDVAFTGPYTKIIPITFRKINNKTAYFTFSSFSDTTVSASNFFNAIAGSIPEAFRPSASIYESIVIMDNSIVNQFATLLFNQYGEIKIFKLSSGDFSGTSGILRKAVCYPLN
jgi:hypothetical protein